MFGKFNFKVLNNLKRLSKSLVLKQAKNFSVFVSNNSFIPKKSLVQNINVNVNKIISRGFKNVRTAKSYKTKQCALKRFKLNGKGQLKHKHQGKVIISFQLYIRSTI